MEKAVIYNLILLSFTHYIDKGTSATTSPSEFIAVSHSTANINFNISLNNTEYFIGTRNWFFGNCNIAGGNENTVVAYGNYSSRLTGYEQYGVTLNHVTPADTGTYTISLTLSNGDPFDAYATLIVQDAVTTTSDYKLVNVGASVGSMRGVILLGVFFGILFFKYRH